MCRKKFLVSFSNNTLGYIIFKYENFTIILSGIAIFIIGMFLYKMASNNFQEVFLKIYFKNLPTILFMQLLLDFYQLNSSKFYNYYACGNIFLSAELLTLVQGIGIILVQTW